MCLELRLAGGQFHLARPAFPVWFVAIGNKLTKHLHCHPSWQPCGQFILRKKKGKKKKKPLRIFPLYALILGRRCPQHAPISWWAPALERQEMTAGLWPSRGDQTPGQEEVRGGPYLERPGSWSQLGYHIEGTPSACHLCHAEVHAQAAGL